MQPIYRSNSTAQVQSLTVFELPSTELLNNRQNIEPTRSFYTPWERFIGLLIEKKLFDPDLYPIGKATTTALLPLKEASILRLRRIFHIPRNLITRDGCYQIDYTIAELILDVRKRLKSDPNLIVTAIVLTGSAVYKVIGRNYFLNFLTSLGLDLNEIPKDLLEDLMNELEKNIVDLDLRLIIPGGILEKRPAIGAAIKCCIASKLMQRYPNDFKSSQSAFEYVHNNAFSNYCNLPYPNDSLTLGLSNGFDFNLDMIWERESLRKYLFIYDAFRIIVPEEILTQTPLAEPVIPVSDYPYPCKVLLNKLGKIGATDNTDLVNKNGHPRSVLNASKGISTKSLHEEWNLLNNFLTEMPFGTSEKGKWIFNTYAETLKGHAGSTPSLKIAFAFNVLTVLVRHQGTFKNKNYSGDEIESIRFMLLNGLYEAFPKLSELQRVIVCILLNQEIAVKEACTYMQACFLLAFLTGQSANKEFCLFYDPLRCPDMIQVQIKSLNDKTWLLVPLNSLLNLQSLFESRTFLSNRFFEDFYFQLMHDRQFIPDLMPNIFPLETLRNMHALFVNHHETIHPLLKPLVFRIGMLVSLMMKTKILFRDLLIAFPSVYNFELNFNCLTLSDSLEQVINIAPVDVYFPILKQKEPTDHLRFLFVETLGASIRPDLLTIALEIIEDNPILIHSAAMEALCLSWTKSNLIAAIVLWQLHHEMMPEEVRNRVLVAICMALENRPIKTFISVINFDALAKEIFNYITFHEDQNPIVWLKLVPIFVAHDHKENALKLLYLLTRPHYFKANPADLIKLWMIVASAHNLPEEAGLRFLLATAFSQGIQEKGSLIFRLLEFCSKILQEHDENARELPKVHKFLFRHLITRLCTFSLDSKSHSPIVQLLLATFFKFRFTKDILAAKPFYNLAQLCTILLKQIHRQNIKLSSQAIEMFIQGYHLPIDYLRNSQCVFPVLDICIELVRVLPAGIANDKLWDHLFWAVHENGGFCSLTDNQLKTIVQMIESSLQIKPSLESLKRPETMQAVQTCLLLACSSDPPEIKKWEDDLDFIGNLHSEDDLRKAWLELIAARIDSKQWVEAGRLFYEHSAIFISLVSHLSPLIYKVIHELISAKEETVMTICLNLLTAYSLPSPKVWDVVLRLCSTMEEGTLHALAWNAFWKTAIPSHVFADPVVRSSCFLGILRGVIKSEQRCILEILDNVDQVLIPEHRERAFKIILKGCLKILNEPEDASHYLEKLLNLRKELVGGNYRSIDVGLIQICCSNPVNYEKARELCDQLLVYDGSSKPEHVNLRCQAVMCMIRSGYQEECESVKSYIKYIENTFCLAEFIKDLVVLLSKSKFESLKEEALRLLIKYDHFEEDESSPFMKSTLSLIEWKLRYFDWEDWQKCYRIFQNSPITSNSWASQFAKVINGLFDYALSCGEQNYLIQAIEDCERSFQLIMKLKCKNDVIIKLCEALSRLTGPEFSRLLLQVCLKLFLEKKVIQVSWKKCQEHPYQAQRVLFIKTLFEKIREKTQIENYILLLNLVCNFVEVIIETAEEIPIIKLYVETALDLIVLFRKTTPFEMKFTQFSIIYLTCKFSGSRSEYDFCFFNFLSIKKNSYLSELPEYKPKEGNITVTDILAYDDVYQITTDVPENDFIQPTDIVIIRREALKEDSREAKALDVYGNYVILVLSLLLERNISISIAHNYLRDTFALNINELIEQIGRYLSRISISRSDSIVVRTSNNVLSLLSKFIYTDSKSINLYKHHEAVTYGLVSRFYKLGLPFERKKVNEILVYLFAPTESQEAFVPIHVTDMSVVNWIQILTTVLDNLISLQPAPIMSYRIKKAFAILTKYNEHLAKKKSTILFDYLNKILDLIETNPDLMIGQDMNFAMLTAVVIMKGGGTVKDNLRKIADRIFNILFCFIKTEKYKFKLDATVNNDPLRATIYCLRIYRETHLYDWTTYFQFLEKLIKPIVGRTITVIVPPHIKEPSLTNDETWLMSNLTGITECLLKNISNYEENSSDKKERGPMLNSGDRPSIIYHDYLNIFEFSSYNETFAQEDYETLARIFNQFIFELFNVNEVKLACYTFRMGKIIFRVYKQCPAVEDEFWNFITTVPEGALNTEWLPDCPLTGNRNGFRDRKEDYIPHNALGPTVAPPSQEKQI